MFEKEADKYAEKVYENRTEIDHYGIADAFQEGAEFGYNIGYRKAMTIRTEIEQAGKANEWHYVKEGCKYPENGESVLVTVLDDDNEKIVTMALFELENNKRFWDIESRLCSIHSGSEEICSKIIAWARVLPAGGEK